MLLGVPAALLNQSPNTNLQPVFTHHSWRCPQGCWSPALAGPWPASFSHRNVSSWPLILQSWGFSLLAVSLGESFNFWSKCSESRDQRPAPVPVLCIYATTCLPARIPTHHHLISIYSTPFPPAAPTSSSHRNSTEVLFLPLIPSVTQHYASRHSELRKLITSM